MLKSPQTSVLNQSFLHFLAPGTISRRPNGQAGHRRLLLDNFDPNAVSTKADKTSSGNGAGNQKTDVESGESAGGPGEIINAKPMQKTVKDHVVALLCDGTSFFRSFVLGSSSIWTCRILNICFDYCACL